VRSRDPGYGAAVSVTTGSLADDSVLGTAAAHATRSVPVARPDERVDDFLARVRGQQFSSAAVTAVCVDDRVVGLVTVERLWASPPDAVVADVMDPDPPIIAGHQNQEEVLWEALGHDEPGLAVIDGDGSWAGLIAPQQLISVLLEERDEDFARLAGYRSSTDSARSASEEPVLRRLWHRLPWPLIGTIGAMVAAGVVNLFEQQLRQQLLIAFFIPGIVYLADAVGTQTEALVIRGMSIGVTIRSVALRELATGFLIGMLIAVVLYPITLLLWGNSAVSLAVSIALLAACTISTWIAMALPWLLSWFRLDPAFGSGPLATIIQDILSILTYLLVTDAIVR